MITRTQNGRLVVLRWLRQGAIGLGLGYVLIAGGLAMQTVLKSSAATQTEHQNKIVSQEIRTAAGEIQRAKRLVVSNEPSDLSAVARLQSAVERSAASRKVTVVEFRASSEVAPFLTRFAKTTNVAGWAQVETQVSLSGSAQSVTSTLASLVGEDIPFEFDSLEITRDKVDAAGDATVIAHATLRVLIRTSKETA